MLAQDTTVCTPAAPYSSSMKICWIDLSTVEADSGVDLDFLKLCNLKVEFHMEVMQKKLIGRSL